jgi:hypothetical protein
VEVAVATSRISQNYTLKIDDGPWITQTGRGGYRSPNLPDGQHTITYGVGALDLLPTFDYLTITAGPSTPLQNRTLIVDDADPSLIYAGKWADHPPHPLLLDFSTGLFRNTSHWSFTIGDTIQFQFTGIAALLVFSSLPVLTFWHAGTSVSIVGVVANVLAGGNISATYTIDNGAPVLRTIPMGTLEGMPMTELFHADVEGGTHAMFVNITQVPSPMALGIDFISYNASFENLASMPGYNPSSDTSSLGSPQPNKSPVGAIVGGTVGGVALIGVVVFCVLIWKRWHRSKRPKNSWSGKSMFQS